MLKTLFDVSLVLHIVAGIVAIATFWLPTLARKGGPLHKQVGRYYSYAMYGVALSALLMCSVRLFSPLVLLPPELADATPGQLDRYAERSRMMGGFLGVLAVLVFANVRHGLLVLAAKNARTELRAPGHLTLLIVLFASGLAGAYIGLRNGFLLLQIFGPLAVVNAASMAHYSFKASLTPRQWVLEHLGNLLGAGIATHTAVLIFGSARIINDWIPKGYELVPWIAPGVIGLIATQIYRRHYQKRFASTSVSHPVSTPVGAATVPVQS